MTYRRGWALVFALGTLITLLTAFVVVLGMVVSHGPGPILYALSGVGAGIGYAVAFVKLWRIRPSTRSN